MVVVKRNSILLGGCFIISPNVKTLGEEAELEAQTFSLAQTPIGSTNVEFSTNPAFAKRVLCAVFIHEFNLEI